MDPDKRKILVSKLAQRHGWRFERGLWCLHEPTDCEERMPDLLAGSKHLDYWAVEELLLRHGWSFQFDDGLFVAVRAQDGFRIRRYRREEVIAIAYIATEVTGPLQKRTSCHVPHWPVDMDHQCWLGEHEPPAGIHQPPE